MSGYRVLGMENAPTTRSSYYIAEPHFMARNNRLRYHEQEYTPPRRSNRHQQRDEYRVTSPSIQFSVRANHVYQSTRTTRD